MDDIFLFGGCVSITIGTGLISLPAAFIVAGVLMIGIAFLIGKQNATASKPVSEQRPTEDR